MNGDNKYEDISVVDLLRLVKTHKILLPDIQRDYVWEMSDIEEFFESIVDGYPVGTCIFWKTNKDILNSEKPNLYHFITKFKKDETKNEKVSEVFNEQGDYFIVLDGQQRITSLNIALFGEYKYYIGGRGKSKNDLKNWVIKELYYNLDYYDMEKDEEKMPKRFCFLTSDDAKKMNVYKVKEVLAYDKINKFLTSLTTITNNEVVIEDLTTLYQRLNLNNGLIHYYCISKDNYDDALDIFVRVNSTGKKLTKSDLLFSNLISGWKTGKENIDNLIATMNSKGHGFKFNRDYLMRACLVLAEADPNLKIKSFNKQVIGHIRNNWQKISETFEMLVNLLMDINMYDEVLASYNATIPLAYYIYKGGKIDSNLSKKEVKKYLSVAMAKRLFGTASNAALSKTRSVLREINCKKVKFSLNLFAGIDLNGKTFDVTESELDKWLDTLEKGPSTYLLLSLLCPDYKLSILFFHQDHCHPKTGFEKNKLQSLNLTEKKITEWQKMRNLLPNLQFLRDSDNESKNKMPLKDWVALGNEFDFHPKKISLELKDFETFFAKRRNLMKNELKKVIDIV